jgi:hypothetical protein
LSTGRNADVGLTIFWHSGIYIFFSASYRQSNTISSRPSMDVQGVYLFTAISMDVHGVSLSTASRLDMQGVSLSAPSSIDMQDVSLTTTSSVAVQGVFISPPAVWTIGHAGCTAYSFSPPTMLTYRVYARPSLAWDPVRYWNASVQIEMPDAGMPMPSYATRQ